MPFIPSSQIQGQHDCSLWLLVVWYNDTQKEMYDCTVARTWPGSGKTGAGEKEKY